MKVQTMVSTETVKIGLSAGETDTCVVPTWCDDVHSVAAPPGKGEPGYGTPYRVGGVSPEAVAVQNALTELAESGKLHNETLGMPLEPYCEVVGQVDRWVRAGERTGQPYTWQTLAAAVSPRLAASLGREPTDEELDQAMRPLNLDLDAVRKKVPPAGGYDAPAAHTVAGGGEDTLASCQRWGLCAGSSGPANYTSPAYAAPGAQRVAGGGEDTLASCQNWGLCAGSSGPAEYTPPDYAAPGAQRVAGGGEEAVGGCQNWGACVGNSAPARAVPPDYAAPSAQTVAGSGGGHTPVSCQNWGLCAGSSGPAK